MVVTRVDVQKLAEENPNSRFKVTNVAILNPGVCFVCGSSGEDERQFVDFGKTVDFYGVVYLCTECLTEVATLLGFKISGDLEAALNFAQNDAKENELRVQACQEEIRAARLLLRNCHCFDSNSVSDASGSVSVDGEADGQAESDVADGNESGSLEGFDGVSESTGDVDESESAKPNRRARKSVE